jgi:WD40 repeat protein
MQSIPLKLTRPVVQWSLAFLALVVVPSIAIVGTPAGPDTSLMSEVGPRGFRSSGRGVQDLTFIDNETLLGLVKSYKPGYSPLHLWNCPSGKDARIPKAFASLTASNGLGSELMPYSHITKRMILTDTKRILGVYTFGSTDPLLKLPWAREDNHSICLSADGGTVAVSREDGIHIWNVERQQETARIRLKRDHYYAMTFSPDSRHLAFVDEEDSEHDRVCVWDLRQRKVLLRLGLRDRSASHLLISPSGNILLCALGDGTICAWDLPSGKTRFQTVSQDCLVTTIAFSPNRQSFWTSTTKNGVNEGCDLREADKDH